jgi:hypothetical protein
MDIVTLIQPIIIAVIPIIVLLLKKVIPDKYAVFYPVIATMLGPILDWLSTYATGASASPLKGLLLGGSAVALREIIDQLKQKAVADAAAKPPAP